MYKVLRAWVPLAVAVTVVCALAHVAVQQSYRSGADDPQIQLAEDAASALSHGASPSSVVGTPSVDMSVSLAPFVNVFDRDGNPLAGSGLLAGLVPVPPRGTFAAATASGRDRVTWQPRPNVRIAAVIVPRRGAAGGWVLSGRSLREVERREDQLTAMSAAAWIAALVLSLAAVVAFALIDARAEKAPDA